MDKQARPLAVLNAKGVSLIEVMISIGFLSVLLIPLGEMYLASYGGAGNVGYFDQASNLAQEMMEEITSKAYEDPTAGAGSFGTEEGSRVDFDDVDDFDSYGPNTPPKDIQNNDMSAYATFSRSVTVVNVSDVGPSNLPRANLNAQTDGSTGFKLVTVTVTWDEGRQMQTLERIVANYK